MVVCRSLTPKRGRHGSNWSKRVTSLLFPQNNITKASKTHVWFEMDLESEARNFAREIEMTLKQAETDIRRASQQLQQQADMKTKQIQPQVKRTVAESIRRTITELEKIESRLKS